MADFFSDGGVLLRKNVPLSPYSAIRIGGVADTLAMPETEDALIALLRELQGAGERYLVVGNATNLLFDDEGFRGTVVLTGALRAVTWTGNTVHAEAGVSLTALAAEASARGLSGLEFAYGIPGTVGGAVYMNAGAFGSEIAAVLTQSTYWEGEKIRTRTRAEHAFGYRDSIYRHTGDVLLSADFSLTPDVPEAVRARAEQNLAARREKQPLSLPNLGSTFKRPAGAFAGKLIADAGLSGTRIGGAEVSEKHAGFIVNRGGATSRDVRALIRLIRETVAAQSGVLLEPEIIYIPEKEG